MRHPRPALSVTASSTPPQSPGVGTWVGSYAAEKQLVTLPKGDSNDPWKGDDGSSCVGKGRIELTIDRNNAIVGTAQGPLGPLRLRGRLDSTTLRAGLTAADPTAVIRLTGWFVGELQQDQITGQLVVANHDGSLSRTAEAQLRKN